MSAVNAFRSSLHEADLDNIKALEVCSAWRSTTLYIKVYLAIAMAVAIGLALPHPLVFIWVVIWIAGRQHSLYILNHDASHYTLFQNRLANQLVATVFSNLVMFHHPEAWSFTQWRRVHMKHHSHLFTEDDPNYVGRQAAGDTARTYTKWQLLWACVMAAPDTWKAFFMGKQDDVHPNSFVVTKASRHHLSTLFRPFHEDREMEYERYARLLFYTLGLGLITYYQVWSPFLYFWLLPMYTIYPMILKFHDLTEHHWDKPSQDVYVNTRSVKRGFLAKLALSFLPRGYHREHHLFPRVNVTNLPKVKALLAH